MTSESYPTPMTVNTAIAQTADDDPVIRVADFAEWQLLVCAADLYEAGENLDRLIVELVGRLTAILPDDMYELREHILEELRRDPRATDRIRTIPRIPAVQ